MKLLRISIVVTLLVAGFAFLPNLPTASAACFGASGTGVEGYDPEVGPMALEAGTVLTATATRPSGTVFIEIYTDTELLYVDEIASPHSVTLEIAADANVTVFFGVYGDGDATFSVTTDNCGGGALVSYPDGVVQGRFVADAQLYWEPGELVTPEVTIPAGKTFHAGGLDESGLYRQVLIVCNWVWVPVGTVGPNFEAPWFGTPLNDSLEIQDSYACVEGVTRNAPVTWIPFGVNGAPL